MNHYASYVPRNEDISYRLLHDDDGEQPLQRSSSRRYQSKDKRTAELVWIKVCGPGMVAMRMIYHRCITLRKTI